VIKSMEKRIEEKDYIVYEVWLEVLICFK
jgi:hypothetical protein